MKANELRQKYLDFFKSKDHAIIPSAPIVPENDPTALFINSGMHPLVPYLMGEKHPKGTRLADSQKCIRTIDIDEVGDTTHHTFFEMLGNWSLGDYFKKEAIEWSWEFLTDPKWLGLDKNRIAVSVFEGDDDAPFDEEAFNTWKKLGVPEARIARLPKEQNWWGPAGETGPCGPDSEMFYWVGDPNEVPDSFNDDNDLWVEIWNDVFMQFNKKADGTFEKLAQQNVDTGMGLIRVLAALNGLDDNYKTELFAPLIEKVEALSGKRYGENDAVTRAMRIIADHIKAAVFMIADGVEPSNTERGYILRRVIRRAVRQAHILGIEDMFTKEVAAVAQDIYKEAYPEVIQERVMTELEKEEEKFRKTLEKGLREFEKNKENISGKTAFNLYQTYGFPLEMIKEEAVTQGISFSKEDEKVFNQELEKHQELSRTASAGMFKGGLADTKEKTMQLHTTAHLMLAGLRKALGDHVHQKGSNINGERIRFDFSHPEKMTDDEIKQVEDYVNGAIKASVPVTMEEMTVDEARAKGAEGAFENKYGDIVKVYTAGMYSTEICGGPHVENTGDIKGEFAITKEKSSSSGVRRIKAVLK
jgi:alanyl-tRNA synthetase